MASTPKNRIVRTIALNAVFEDATPVSNANTNFNQGDLLCFDVATLLIRPVASESVDSANFLGIAEVTVQNGSPVGPYQGLATTSRQIPGHFPGPVYGVNASLTLKSGDALNPGALVYLDPTDGPQFVSASGTNAIGVNAGAGITGNGVLNVVVRLGARYPGNTLKL